MAMTGSLGPLEAFRDSSAAWALGFRRSTSTSSAGEALSTHTAPAPSRVRESEASAGPSGRRWRVVAGEVVDNGSHPSHGEGPRPRLRHPYPQGAGNPDPLVLCDQ